MVETDRLLDRVQTVAERGLEIDQPCDADAFRRVHDVRRAGHVGARVLAPVVRILVRGRRMDHLVGTEVVEDSIDQRGVRNRPFHDGELRMRSQVVAPTGRVVVDHQDVVAGGQETIGEMRADEARAAGDEHLHGNTSSFTARA